jgi:hypothetical protein
VNANPLAPLPIVWTPETVALASAEEPIQWANRYSVNGLGPMLSQTKALADSASTHRIVGCGVKVRLTDPTGSHSTRGQMEGGQFDVASSRYTNATSSVVAARSLNDYSSLGAFGSAWNSPVYKTVRQSIQNSISHSHGYGDVQDGIAVRWTDKNQFQFVPTIYSNVVAPSKTFYTNGFEPFSPVTNAFSSVGETGTPQWDFATGVFNVDMSGAYRATYYALPCTINQAWLSDGAAALTASATSETVYCYRNSYVGTTLPKGLGSRISSDTSAATQEYANFDQSRYPMNNGQEETIKWSDPVQNFGDALYVDVTGASSTQYVIIEVAWHVEYVPKMTALDYGMASPVDMSYDALAAVAGDETSFPIVTQSDGFFKSLRRGMSDASDGLSRMLGRKSDLGGST